MDCAVYCRHFDLALHNGGELLPNGLHRLAVCAPAATQDLRGFNLPDHAAVKVKMKLEKSIGVARRSLDVAARVLKVSQFTWISRIHGASSYQGA